MSLFLQDVLCGPWTKQSLVWQSQREKHLPEGKVYSYILMHTLEELRQIYNKWPWVCEYTLLELNVQVLA